MAKQSFVTLRGLLVSAYAHETDHRALRSHLLWYVIVMSLCTSAVRRDTYTDNCMTKAGLPTSGAMLMTLRALWPSTASWRSKKATGSASGSCREGVCARLNTGSGVCLYAHDRGGAPTSSALVKPAERYTQCRPRSTHMPCNWYILKLHYGIRRVARWCPPVSARKVRISSGSTLRRVCITIWKSTCLVLQMTAKLPANSKFMKEAKAPPSQTRWEDRLAAIS